MTVVEWQSLPAEALAPLYRREQARWRDRLGWDTESTWATVETARITWGLPGYVCRDAGNRIVGWTFYVRQDERLNVGGLVSDAPEATRALLDALRARKGHVGGFFFADAAAGCETILAAEGIACERYSYSIRRTGAAALPASRLTARPWQATDAPATALLLREAYGEAGRLFAQGNTREEWQAYVDQLVAHGGCGVLQPELSRVVAPHGVLAGVALVTALSPATAHLAQIAVASNARRAGTARDLLNEVLRSTAAAGYRHLSLLVSEQNRAACRLYDAHGFEPCASFLSI